MNDQDTEGYDYVIYHSAPADKAVPPAPGAGVSTDTRSVSDGDAGEAIKYDRSKPSFKYLTPFAVRCLYETNPAAEMLMRWRKDREWIYLRNLLVELRCDHNAVHSVLQLGADKYGAYDWQRGMRWSQVYDAAMRHLLYYPSLGEELDAESGQPHTAHAFARVMFLEHYSAYGIGDDDL